MAVKRTKRRGSVAGRRDFLKASALAGAGFWIAGSAPRPRRIAALDEIRFACIGIDGKGSSDSEDAKAHGKVVAICDIDETRLGKAAAKFPGAQTYYDFRKMLEEQEDSIDAVTVSTPDHTHAAAALMAMRMGKHCFCQKPLTHSIYEARLMAETAREKKVITQMGNQGTALACLRKSAALVRAGVIGAVREVHIWTNRPVWPQSTGLKVAELDPPPADIHWAEWIGPAEYRPFSHEIHPFKWRGFWDFGTGALGDMACHTLNMAYMALDLRNPTRVVAETAGHDGNCYPKWSVIEFEFPERNGRPPVKLFWYDGGKMPRMSLLKGCPKMPTPDEESAAPKHYDSAALVIGDKGKFYSPGDYGGEELTTGAVFGDEFVPQDKLPESDIDVVRSSGHFTEFAEAICGDGPTPMSNFPDYAGPLTETVLLGNLAVWQAGTEIQWNAETMEVVGGSEDVNRIVRPEYRNGYALM